jgi:ABC-type glycerol-3-phosphate transport system substrate-binding protein
MEIQWFIQGIIKKIRKIFTSTDKILWVWAIVMAVGLLAFNFFGRSLPRLRSGTNLVFVQWWEDDLETDTLQKLIAEYEEQNSGVKIQLEHKSRSELRGLLDEIAADGSGNEKKQTADADIFTIEPYWMDDLEKAGILALRTGKRPEDDPLISFINPLFYNIDLLKASGFDRPPKNREEFLAYSKAITGQGNYGAALSLAEEDPLSVSRHLLSWLWASGIGLENGVAAEIFRFDAKPVIETLTFLNQLKPSLYPPPFFMTEKERQRFFAEGKIGMMIGSVSEIKELREKMGDVFSITTVPGLQTYVGKPVFFLSGWFMGVNEKSAKKEEAAKFAAFLRGRAGILAAAAFAIPGSGGQYTESVKTDPFYSKAIDMSNAGEMIREMYKNKPAAPPELNNIVREEVQRMFDGSQGPEETAQAIQSRWEKL